MGLLKALQMDKDRPLYQVMGFKESNDVTVKVAMMILSVKKLAKRHQGLALMNIGKIIRRERLIVMCCVCHRHRVNGHWYGGKIPTGMQSHTFCPPCFETWKKENLGE